MDDDDDGSMDDSDILDSDDDGGMDDEALDLLFFQASRRIQSRQRRLSAQTLLRHSVSSIVRIQAGVRRWLTRTRLSMMHRAATRLQAEQRRRSAQLTTARERLAWLSAEEKALAALEDAAANFDASGMVDALANVSTFLSKQDAECPELVTVRSLLANY